LRAALLFVNSVVTASTTNSVTATAIISSISENPRSRGRWRG
jgi:hypothetical protein